MNDDKENTLSLLDEAKLKCNITSTSPIIVKKITGIVKNAIPTLKRKLGINDESFDFEKDGQEKTLLLNYVFYDWNNQLELFEINYFNDIKQLRSYYKIQQRKINNETDQ